MTTCQIGKCQDDAEIRITTIPHAPDECNACMKHAKAGIALVMETTINGQYRVRHGNVEVTAIGAYGERLNGEE
jgi:hypothetical protein